MSTRIPVKMPEWKLVSSGVARNFWGIEYKSHNFIKRNWDSENGNYFPKVTWGKLHPQDLTNYLCLILESSKRLVLIMPKYYRHLETHAYRKPNMMCFQIIMHLDWKINVTTKNIWAVQKFPHQLYKCFNHWSKHIKYKVVPFLMPSLWLTKAIIICFCLCLFFGISWAWKSEIQLACILCFKVFLLRLSTAKITKSKQTHFFRS